jgi:hypothetical protein
MASVKKDGNHPITISQRLWRPRIDGQKESGDAVGAAARPSRDPFLVERVRDVVEGRVQLVADALHRTNGGDGNQRCDQTIFNGSRAFFVLKELHKLGHHWSPIGIRFMHLHAHAAKVGQNVGF